MFPTCPACQQSVLDDDAVFCPFCGAHMKTGKPGKVPSAKAAAPVRPTKTADTAESKTPAPAAAPARASAKAASAATSAAAGDDDDPFGVGAATASRAIALLPRPAKGKTVRLICPMCETQGFAGAEAAGKEVKCGNEKCPLPIFTAPKSDTAANTAEHAVTVTIKKPKASLALMVTAVGTVAIAAGSVWHFMFNQPAGVIPPPAPPTTNNSSGQAPVATTNPDDAKKIDEQSAKAPTAKSRAAALRAQILPVMVAVSLDKEKNRSKPYCRRLTAEAYIEAGDLKGARENLAQILVVGPKLAFHQVAPLTQIGWREFEEQNLEAAKAAIDEALKAGTDLPKFGRLSFDSATELAALMVVTGRSAEAKNLMAKYGLPPGSQGNLAALARRVQLIGTFDLDAAAESLPVFAWKSPQWVVTTITLVLRGHAASALEWARSAPSTEIKAECLAAWADAAMIVPQSKVAESTAALTTALQDESAATQARAWAKAATALATSGQKNAASEALKKAVAAIKSIALPNNFVLPDMKEMFRLELPDPLPARLNAIAAAEVSRAQSRLGFSEPSAATLVAAVQHLRGHASSSVAAQSRMDAITKGGSTEILATLKKTLDLKTDDQTRQALTQYRAKCKSALDAANVRFALQGEILKAAIAWAPAESVFTEANSRSGDDTPEEAREPFLKTSLVVQLGQRLRAAGKTDLARVCDGAASAGNFSDPRDALERETADAVAKGDVLTVAKNLGRYEPPKAEGQRNSTEDSDWPLHWGLRQACRLAKSGKSDKALELVAAFPDMLWREEGYELVCAYAARQGAAEPLWTKYRRSLLSLTEKIAIFRGLCAGLAVTAAATE